MAPVYGAGYASDYPVSDFLKELKAHLCAGVSGQEKLQHYIDKKGLWTVIVPTDPADSKPWIVGGGAAICGCSC